MKKLILIVFLLLTVVGYSQTTHYANQVTITWDAPTTFEDGTLIPPEINIDYDVYLREKGGEQVLIAEIQYPPYTVTLPTPGLKYDIGVLAKYQVGDDWLYSVIAWSIQEGWDVGFFVPANPPINLRIK